MNGHYLEAIAHYQSALLEDPGDETSFRYLGNLLFDQGMYESSISLYRDALKHHPNDPYFLERAGTLLVASPDTSLRDLEAGKEYLERAFLHKSSRINTQVSSGRSLAWTYAKLGNLPGAISTIRQTIHIGRREKISSSYLAELESLYQNFRELEQ
jgi:tetratricopeptide (TPR) repeat protein